MHMDDMESLYQRPPQRPRYGVPLVTCAAVPHNPTTRPAPNVEAASIVVALPAGHGDLYQPHPSAPARPLLTPTQQQWLQQFAATAQDRPGHLQHGNTPENPATDAGASASWPSEAGQASRWLSCSYKSGMLGVAAYDRLSNEVREPGQSWLADVSRQPVNLAVSGVLFRFVLSCFALSKEAASHSLQTHGRNTSPLSVCAAGAFGRPCNRTACALQQGYPSGLLVHAHAVNTLMSGTGGLCLCMLVCYTPWCAHLNRHAGSPLPHRLSSHKRCHAVLCWAVLCCCMMLHSCQCCRWLTRVAARVPFRCCSTSSCRWIHR